MKYAFSEPLKQMLRLLLYFFPFSILDISSKLHLVKSVKEAIYI